MYPSLIYARGSIHLREVGAAVLGEALFGFLAAYWPLFAVAYRVYAIRRHTLSDQKLFYDIRTAVAETEVVFFTTAVVAVSFDRKPNVRVSLKP